VDRKDKEQARRRAERMAEYNRLHAHCAACGEDGHTMAECTARPHSVHCGHCSEVGHVTQNCFKVCVYLPRVQLL
jgi:6-phosphogluconolactonase/glucosamine-6-phosphate isomerase/deaminase